MIDLKNVDLLALQSQYMQQDRATQALCAALTPLLRDLGVAAQMIILYPRIDELSGPILDELAWGMHVDAYDALAADTEKRSMIKNSIEVHYFKGMPFAVEKIVESVFGDAGKIEEWFQYSGQPYHFRMDIYCKDRGVTVAEQLRAVQLVMAGKRLTAELDGIQLILTQSVTAKIASAATWGAVLEIYPIGEYDTHSAKLAVASAQTATINVYDLEG
jgi:phage tail P2-like protein